MSGVTGYCDYVGGSLAGSGTADDAAPFLYADLSAPPNDTNTGDFEVIDLVDDALARAADVSAPAEIEQEWATVLEAAQSPDKESRHGDPVVSGTRIRGELENLRAYRKANCGG